MSFLQTCSLGAFTVQLSSPSKVAILNPSIIISISSQHNRVLWQTRVDEPFLSIANGTNLRSPIVNGNYQLEDLINAETFTTDLTIEKAAACNPSDVSFGGKLIDKSGNQNAYYAYSVKFYTKEAGVSGFNELGFNISIHNALVSITQDHYRVFLRYLTDPSEYFYGFGESFSYFNLKGKRVPILVSEQGNDIQPKNSMHIKENESTTSPKRIIL